MITKKLYISSYLVLIFFTSLSLVQVISYNQESIFPESRYGGTLVESSTLDARSLNPVFSLDTISNRINNLIFESMITIDTDMLIIPQLAKSWTVSSDKLDCTINLRQDVFWHDGERFDAHDVIFTLERMAIATFQEEYEIDNLFYSNFNLDNLVPFTLIDNFTIIFHAKSSYPSILNNLMFKIIPEHAYLNHLGEDGIAHTADDCWSGEGVYTFYEDPRNYEPIGTGCMMFNEWERDNHLSLIRNSIANNGTGYWNQHDAYLDGYMLKIDRYDENWLPLKPRDYHMIYLSSTSQEDIEDMIADPEFNVYSSLTFRSDHIAFQTDLSKGNLYGNSSRDFTIHPNHFAGYEWMMEEHPEIYGHLVRQALNYAIDKQGLIDHVYPQGYRNLGPMYLAQYEWYNDQVEHYDYDIAKANNLLDQAGFGATATDPLRKELNFTISYPNGNTRREKTCEFARDQWAILGIDVEIEAIEWISMLSTHYDERNFDAMSAGWAGGGGDPDLRGVWSFQNIMPGGEPIGLNPDGSWIWSGNPRTGGLNYMSYWNPAVDFLMEKALGEEEFNIRKNYYDQIQDLIVDDSPYIWLLANVNIIAIDSQFYGFVDGSLAGFWPEPIGFRNIYYIPEELSETTTENSNISSFELFSTLVALICFIFFLKKKNKLS